MSSLSSSGCHSILLLSLTLCSCSHSYLLFTALPLSLFCVSRPQSSSQKSSQRSHGNQSPYSASAERVHEHSAYIPPASKCHLCVHLKGGKGIKVLAATRKCLWRRTCVRRERFGGDVRNSTVTFPPTNEWTAGSLHRPSSLITKQGR